VAIEFAARPDQRAAKSVEPGCGRRTAQGAQLQRLRGALDPIARQAEAYLRMREKREHPRRLEVECRDVRRETRGDAGLRLRQRHAGRVLDRDLPARQLGRDAFRQASIGRDEGRGAARIGERFAQRNGGRKSLVALVERLDELDAGAALACQVVAKLGRHGGPFVRGVGGAESLREHAAARREFLGHRSQRAHARARDLHVVLEKAPQHRLRMPMHRIAVVRLSAADGAPARLVEIGVEPGQDHGPVRQTRDGVDQSGSGRDRTCRSGGNDGGFGPLAQQSPRLRVNQRAAPQGRITRLPVGQDARPVVGGDTHEVERQPEIFRVVGLDRLGELVPWDVLGR
jgi:hypothetical protein